MLGSRPVMSVILLCHSQPHCSRASTLDFCFWKVAVKKILTKCCRLSVGHIAAARGESHGRTL